MRWSPMACSRFIRRAAPEAMSPSCRKRSSAADRAGHATGRSAARSVRTPDRGAVCCCWPVIFSWTIWTRSSRRVRLFRHRRWEVIVLHVIHPMEERLPEGNAFRFEGLENDGQIDCSPAGSALYEKRFAAHATAVRGLALAADSTTASLDRCAVSTDARWISRGASG